MLFAAPESPENSLAELVQAFWPLAVPSGELPDPTPPEGPDPYGNPDPEWLQIDWSDHVATVRVPGRDGEASVNYVELAPAAGEPRSRLDLVLVHGLSGSWQNWLENIPHFARRHRVIAFDLPGFGASPMPPWEVSIEAYGRLLRDLCTTLEVRDCAVVGNSMGGFIACEAAIGEPGRFERLALVSAAGISHARLRREPAEVVARLGVASAPLVLRVNEAAMRRPRVREAAFHQLVHAPLELRTELLYEFFHNGAGRPGFAAAVLSLFGYDILDRLSEIEVPTLVVWGRNDRIVPPGDALEYGRRIRRSQTVIFDRTGHVPMAERPLRFNRVLETFLEAPSS